MGFSGSGYYGRSATDFRQLLDAHGLSAPAFHTDLETLQTRIEQVGEAAQILEHRYAGIAAIPEELRQTPDDYRRLADTFNEIGRKAGEHGFRFLYHNHGYGLAPVDGSIPLQLLLDRLDPDVLSLEMDVYWTVAGAADPIEYLQTYPELYRLMHVKDMKEVVTFAGDGGTAQQWMELFPYMTYVGNGALALEPILEAAVQTGVEHFFVEYDIAPEPELALRGSYAFLSSLDAD